MRTKIKAAIEKLSGDAVWFEPSANLDEVRRLVRKFAPVAIKQPKIRIGGEGDGGYLLPDDLDGITACISPGVSTEVGFDSAMAERGVDVYMADASVPGSPVQHSRFHFQPKFLDVVEDEKNMRLDSLCASVDGSRQGDRLLQMDIEGAEFRVLPDASDETLKSFRIMVIEFHHLTCMFAAFPLTMIRAVFEKLLRFHHEVHFHPNNVCGATVRGGVVIPPVMEFTFYRKDRAEIDPNRKLQFPHPLDRDNISKYPPVVLPECWR